MSRTWTLTIDGDVEKEVTLTFEKAGAVPVEFSVQSVGARAPADLPLRDLVRLYAAGRDGIAALEPDLVVNTGDNLSHPRAVPSVVQTLDPLLARPGLFVFGSNDYFGPTPKNPAKYFDKDHERKHGDPLPWQDLRAAFSERGWLDATHAVRRLEAGGVTISVAGVDDPHIERDRYETIAGRADESVDLRLALTHSPEPRVLDRFAADGYDLADDAREHLVAIAGGDAQSGPSDDCARRVRTADGPLQLGRDALQRRVDTEDEHIVHPRLQHPRAGHHEGRGAQRQRGGRRAADAAAAARRAGSRW